MFEALAAVAVVAFLMVSTAGNYIVHLRDDRATQGMLIPILFFSLAVMVLVYPRSLAENVAVRQGTLTTEWRDDSVMAASLAFIMAMLTFCYGAFRYHPGTDEVSREKTVFHHVKEERKSLSAGHALSVVLMFFVAVLCLGQYFSIWPRERYASLTFTSLVRGPNQASRALSLLTDADIDRLEAVGVNGTELMSGALGCDVNASSSYETFLTQAASGVWNYDLRVGLSDLLEAEILGLAVLSIVGIAVSIGGAVFLLLEDAGTVISALQGILSAIAVALRAAEMKSQFGEISLEWFIPVIGLLSFIQMALTLFVRVDRRLLVWTSYADLEADFFMGETVELGDFLYERLGFRVDPEVVQRWTQTGRLDGLRKLITEHEIRKQTGLIGSPPIYEKAMGIPSSAPTTEEKRMVEEMKKEEERVQMEDDDDRESALSG